MPSADTWMFQNWMYQEMEKYPKIIFGKRRQVHCSSIPFQLPIGQFVQKFNTINFIEQSKMLANLFLIPLWRLASIQQKYEIFRPKIISRHLWSFFCPLKVSFHPFQSSSPPFTQSVFHT
jgi:hypothetical protein